MNSLQWKKRWQHCKTMQFILFMWRRFQCFNIPLVSASLTFTTLLALVPLFMVTITAITAFPIFADTASKFNDFITTVVVPAAGADSVRQYLVDFRNNASSLTTIGVMFMIITSLMLIQTIEHSFNQIWQAHQSRPFWIRILLYWALLTLGPVVLGVSLSTFSQVANQSEGVLHYAVLINIFHIVTNLALTTLLLFLLYKWVPFRMVAWRHALCGAVLTAAALEGMRWGFAFYINHFNSYRLIYGTFAAIPIFLLWLNLLWILLLTGAVFTSSLPYWRNAVFNKIQCHNDFIDALTILYHLARAQQKGQISSAVDLQAHLNMAESSFEALLLRLSAAGFVAETERGWILQTSADCIMLDSLFYLLIYHAEDDSRIAHSVNILLTPVLHTLHISLAEWIRHGHLDIPPLSD